MSVGKIKSRIASLRDERDMTQLELSQAVGVTETTIANWEKGRSGIPMIFQLIKLCRTLDCQLEDLVEVADEDKDIPATRISDLSLADLRDIIGTKDKFKGGGWRSASKTT